MPLAVHWVERLFEVLIARYGSAWFRKWDGIDAESVKADWGAQLDGVSADAIGYGLANLPLDFPPTSARFRCICLERRTYDEQPPVLAAPPSDPARVTTALRGMRSATTAGRRRDPKAWAHALRDREAGGERLTHHQRSMWRAAVGERSTVAAGEEQ